MTYSSTTNPIKLDNEFSLQKLGKNTPEYKALCLIMYILTGFEFWKIEGTTNH